MSMRKDNQPKRSSREIEQELCVENDASKIASLSRELNEALLEEERRKVAVRLGRRVARTL